jgi:hypothetical protein
MSIKRGIDQIVGEKQTGMQKQYEDMQANWRDIRNKLDGMLMRTNVLKGDEIRRKCQMLDGQSLEERQAHISANWGQQYATKVEPLLIQLRSIEKELSKFNQE